MNANHQVPLPIVGLSGFDAGLSEEEAGAQGAIHRFAAEVMRPIGREVDKMAAEEAYLPGSPFWQFHQEIARLGLGPDALAGLDPAAAARMHGGTGLGRDAGLAVSAGAGAMPMIMAHASGNRELIDLCAGKLGCWAATQPDRGSDGLILYAEERHPGSRGNKGNLQATIVGEEVVLNGQTSAWVSNGPVAQVALLDVAADYGDGCSHQTAAPTAAMSSFRLTSMGSRGASRWRNSANAHSPRARSISTMSACRGGLPSPHVTTMTSSTRAPGRTPALQ